VEAQYLQANYWAPRDPSRSDRLFEGAFEIEASMGVAPDPVNHALFYLSRLRRASGHDEALALLGDWRVDPRGSTPTPLVAAAFALYGDTPTALDLMSRSEPSGAPMEQYLNESSEAVLASAQAHFDVAEQHLATLVSVVRDFAVPRGEVACLIGFAKVALDRGDYVRASRLLAVVNGSVGPKDRPFRTALDALLYVHCTGVLREVLDPETMRTSQAEGSALSVEEALDAELSRSGATAAQ
jgi:hypothetical protein